MRLKGSGSAVGTKRQVRKWSVEEKIRVYRAVKVDKTPAKTAFEQLQSDLGITLPASYINDAPSHVWRFGKELNAAVERKDESVITLLRENDLLDE